MLNLLKLDEEILNFMFSLDNTDERLGVLTERKLRSLLKIADRGFQKEEFRRLVGKIRSP